MPFEYVDASEVPPRPVKKQASKSAAYFREILEGLEPGKVAIIEPQDAQSVRGIKVSVGRIASSLGIKVHSWSLDDEQKVYVALED